MNLRKLLCGLLALCLLLTMAPAALMEGLDQQVEVVEAFELDDTTEVQSDEVALDAPIPAEDFKALSYDDSTKLEGTLTLPTDFKGQQSGSLYIGVGDSLTIELDAENGYEDYEFTSVVTRNARIVDPDDIEIDEAEGTSVSLTVGDKIGDGVLQITAKNIKGNGRKTYKFALTLKVYDPTVPTSVNFEIDDGNGDTKVASKATIDMTDDDLEIIGNILPKGADGELIWSSSNTKVATLESSLTDDGEPNYIVPHKAGTATITAKVNSKVSATFKVTVTDKYAPKSIKLYSDDAKLYIGTDYDSTLCWTVITPGRPDADKAVTLTTSDVKKAGWLIYDDDGNAKVVDKIDAGKGILKGFAEGKVKLTAKTYNGKTSTITIEVVDPTKPKDIAMWGFMKKERATVELYENEALDKSTFLIVPQLINEFGQVIDLNELEEDSDAYKAAARQYANIKWTSSNKKVATVDIYKNYFGYSHEAAAIDLSLMYDPNYNPVGEYFDEDFLAYGALVQVQGLGTTTITAKTPDGKKSFSITLKVENTHDAELIEIVTIDKNKVNKFELVDLEEYVNVYPSDFWGDFKIEPTHSTSKIIDHGNNLIEFRKSGSVTFKVTAGGKTKKFTLSTK